MKYYISNSVLSKLFLPLLFFTIFVLSGCSVKLVADHDSKTYEEILRVGKSIDEFYGDLLETSAASRNYQKYSGQYVKLESELRSLYVRNKSRPLNEESTKISESILKLWVKYKERHKVKNSYKDGNAKLDRNKFVNIFISAASAELAKNLEDAKN